MSAGSDVLGRIHGFVTAVRRAGVPVSPDRVQALLRALDELSAATGPGASGLYWAGRLTLCGSPDDLARYQAVWRALAAAPEPARPAQSPAPLVRRRVAAPFRGPPAGPAGDPDEAELAVAARASADEVLRHRDLAELTPAEREEVRRLLAVLAPATPQRPTRRLRPARGGRVDPQRTLRGIVRGLGEPARLARRRRGIRPRRLVLLLDVSGSMAPYTDALLRFAHAAVRSRSAAGRDRAGWGDTEVFTIGTRLTRITAALRRSDPEVALRRAGQEVPDWRGGTRLGDALTTFLRTFGHRGMARRAVVVVCSDGWECGDARRLGEAVAWLARLAHRVLWVTPHAGRPEFAPTVAGLAAARPHLDRLVAGHSLAALAELAELVRRA